MLHAKRHEHTKPKPDQTNTLPPLDATFRKQLGLSANAGLAALKISEGLDAAQWAEHEFGSAPLGDKQLSKRLVNIAHAKAQNPGCAFSGAIDGKSVTTQSVVTI